MGDSVCCRRYHVLASLLSQIGPLGSPIVGVEIGVNNAITSAFLLKNMPQIHLTGIEPFIGVTPQIRAMSENEYAKYPERARLIETRSEDFVDRVPDGSLDFVFIDGNHSFHAVAEDIRRWSAKVKPGGLVSGHDLFNPAFEGVN